MKSMPLNKSSFSGFCFSSLNLLILVVFLMSLKLFKDWITKLILTLGSELSPRLETLLPSL